MKLIIAGTRTFNDYKFLKEKLDYFLQNITVPITIVSGKCKGPDTLGERYAEEKGYEIKEFPADWDRFKYFAGPHRNAEMAKYATHCIIFWDGKSKGSSNMIHNAEKYKLILKIVRYGQH